MHIIQQQKQPEDIQLLVPEILVEYPGQELVENGDFASSLDNWTASGVQFSHTTNNVGGNTSGKLMYYAMEHKYVKNIYQDVPTVSGARYVLSFDSSSDTAGGCANTIDIAGTSVYTLGDNNNSKLDRTEVGFTASSSTTRIRFTSTVSNRAYLDNVSVLLLYQTTKQTQDYFVRQIQLQPSPRPQGRYILMVTEIILVLVMQTMLIGHLELIHSL